MQQRGEEAGLLGEEAPSPQQSWSRQKVGGVVGLSLLAAAALVHFRAPSQLGVTAEVKISFMQAQEYGQGVYGQAYGQGYGAQGYGNQAYGGAQDSGYYGGEAQGYGGAQAAQGFQPGFVPFQQAQQQAQQPAAPPPAAPQQFPQPAAQEAPAQQPPPQAAPPPQAQPPAETPPPAEEVECAWEGENCVHSKCCKRVGLTCWEKMADSWASCSKSCEELKQFGDDAEWTCKGLGPAGAPKIIGPSDAPPASTTLFCFMVITPAGVVPPGVKEGYEQVLVDEIRKAGLSAFACEGSAVYEGTRAETGEWKSIKNTDIFVQVWKKVQGDGLWQQHDWTVKVDSDAVFFPDRLKMHIQGSRPPMDKAVYFRNIDFKFHFMGALEVMNRKAVELFLKDLDQCAAHIGNDGGEDIFTMSCLDAIGAYYMEDFSLLDDKYSVPAEFNLFDVDRCKDDSIVAFHPYKAVNSWMGCHKVAMHEVTPGQFTSCVHRWEGEACSLSSDLDHPGNHPDPGSGIVA